MQEAGADHEGNAVAIWELEEIRRALFSGRGGHAEGFAFLAVAVSFLSE